MKTKTPIRPRRLITIFFCALAVCQTQIVLASEITPERMIDLINQSRAEAGVSYLDANLQLMSAAEAKVEDMFRFQYFDHNSPGGITPWYWIKQSGYDYFYAGENLAIDFVTAEGAHKAFMESFSHQRNILNPNYSEIGIATRSDIFEETKSVIIVEMFGSPRQISESKSYRNAVIAKEQEIGVKAVETKNVEIIPAIMGVILENENDVDKVEKAKNESFANDNINVIRDNVMYDPELQICKVYNFEFMPSVFKFVD